MRALLFCLLVLLSSAGQADDWVPLDVSQNEAKLTEYIAAGWTTTDILLGLRRWFGWNHEIGPNGKDVLIVWRRPDGAIYYLQKIGELP